MKSKFGIVKYFVLAFVCIVFAFACENRSKHKHTFGEVEVVTAATCTTAGEQKKTCLVCGDVQTETIKALGHDFSGDAEGDITVEATCTQPGSSKKTCRREGCNEIQNEPIPAKGHTYGDWQVLTPATCTQDGVEHKLCTVCSAEGETRVIPAINHTADASTWEYDDENHWHLCSVCDAVVNTSVEEHDGDPCTVCGWQSGPTLLSGEFSVSATKKVRFTKGNLYWDGSKFKTEENQYDYRTLPTLNSVIDGEFSKTGTPTNNVGLLYWSKDIEKTYALYYDVTGATTTDDFALTNGGAFRGFDVLSKDEWEYLISTRDSAAQKYGLATISLSSTSSTSGRGLVLLPEDWNLPTSLSFTSGNSSYSANQYDIDQWLEMENAGAVFMPAPSCYRDGYKLFANTDGYYHSSTSDTTSKSISYALLFNISDVKLTTFSRECGIPVRLVKTV